MNEAGVETPSAPTTARWSGGPARRLLRLWREGVRPDLFLFLPGEPDLQPTEPVGVPRAHQRLSYRSGEPVPAEWYIERFPLLSADPDLALDLIYNEYLLEEEAGKTSRLDDYLARFPQFADTIKVQVAFHRAIEDVPP